MANEQGRLEIGHVLFIDVIGYSKLSPRSSQKPADKDVLALAKGM